MQYLFLCKKGTVKIKTWQINVRLIIGNKIKPKVGIAER